MSNFIEENKKLLFTLRSQYGDSVQAIPISALEGMEIVSKEDMDTLLYWVREHSNVAREYDWSEDLVRAAKQVLRGSKAMIGGKE